jgi:hypothetical protein
MHRGLDYTRRDRVHADTLGRVFQGERLGHGLQAARGQIRERRIDARDRLVVQAAMLETTERSTSGRVRPCAIETMAFGKSTQFTPRHYDFSE